MMKQEIRGIGVYACLGFLCEAMGIFLDNRPAFTDQGFICGLLCGAGIILLLHAVYYIGASLGKSKEDIDKR